MPEPIALTAVCDILHLGVRRGETVVIWGHPGAPVTATRALPPNYGAVLGCVEDGTLQPVTVDDAARLGDLRTA